MSSKTPHVIRHFIPLQFSKQALDYQNKRTRNYVQVEQNPLQNMKLRSCKQQNDSNFTLVFKNKSNKQFTSKFKIKTNRLLKQMQQQSQKCSIIKHQIINQQLKHQNKPKPISCQRPTTFKSSNPKTTRAEPKNYRNGFIRQKQKQVVPRKIFSCKSFRKFTTVSTAKPGRRTPINEDFVSQFQPWEFNLQVKGRKNYIDF